ncbi:hypothetical protein LRAMOSA10519 [Lichtheimia ramosa]|uniref:Cyclin N-terminal domain-containing protein n=1 Tax=Lichtheimia ramosa TaxID=688394 RepID=A0A077WPW0_9FUNG|nr:hypothetical protein LRAMOSA10519 [Lichtheimia ramosa]
MGDFEGKFAAAIHGPVSSDLLAHVSQQAARVIPCHPETSQQSQAWPPPLRTFISVIVKRSAVRAGTLFAALVFLERLQRRLQNVARGMPCTCHRIFLATLIVTSKALHDASPKNKHWAKYAMWCFSIAEINLMEKQLLTILNYRLVISIEDLHQVFMMYDNCLHRTPPLASSSSSSLESSGNTDIDDINSITSHSGEHQQQALMQEAAIAKKDYVQPDLYPRSEPTNSFSINDGTFQRLYRKAKFNN